MAFVIFARVVTGSSRSFHSHCGSVSYVNRTTFLSILLFGVHKSCFQFGSVTSNTAMNGFGDHMYISVGNVSSRIIAKSQGMCVFSLSQ